MQNTLVTIRTKYATITQSFKERIDAVTFLNNSRKKLDVVSYEIKTYKEL